MTITPSVISDIRLPRAAAAVYRTLNLPQAGWQLLGRLYWRCDQKLVERCERRLAARRGEDFDPIKHPGYPEITHDEWARWNAANAEFQVNRQAVNRTSSR